MQKFPIHFCLVYYYLLSLITTTSFLHKTISTLKVINEPLQAALSIIRTSECTSNKSVQHVTLKI
jgi:hypothetical protein